MAEGEILYKPGVTIDNFASDGGEEWNQAWGPECLYRDILPHLRSGARVLDLGCGSGRCSIGFGFTGADVLGVDEDIYALEAYSKRLYGTGVKVQLLRADIRRIPLNAAGVFDAVVAVETFNHFTKSGAVGVVETLPLLLSDKGFVVVSFPSTLSRGYELMREWKERIEPYTYRYWCNRTGVPKLDNYAFFEPGEVESIFIRAGMGIISAETTWAPQRNCNWTVVARKR